MAEANIYKRVNEVRKEINYIQKDKAVSTGGGSYKAVTHDAVTGMVRASLIKHGIVIVPTIEHAVFHQKEPDSKQRLYEATYSIAFVNEENPDDKITMMVNAHALDSGDKAPGKALSYATKYAMLKLFNIETGEDDESRYQQEEFDVQAAVDFILESTSMEELKTRHVQQYRIAEALKNRDAMKAIITAKDKRKAELLDNGDGK